MKPLLSLLLALWAGLASAQTVGVPPAPNASYTVTSSQTLVISRGTFLYVKEIGGAGGSGCGIVEPSGTATSGGGGGGTGATWWGWLKLSQFGSAPYTLVINIGAAGANCVASGITNGSTGSAPSGGGETYITINGTEIIPAYGGGAGANGQSGAASGGGASGSIYGAGGNASGSTNGTQGAVGGIPGGSGSCSPSYSMPSGCNGQGSSLGVSSSYNFGQQTIEQPGSSGVGEGLAATPVAIAGGNGVAPWGNQVMEQRGAGGNASCTAGSQNAANSTYLGIGFYGVGGSSGASCTAANGGNGGSAAGFGSPGGPGSSTLTGFTAGSAGASDPGGVQIGVY